MKKHIGVVGHSNGGGYDRMDEFPFHIFETGDQVKVHWPDGSFSDNRVVVYQGAHIEAEYRGVKCYVPLIGLVVELTSRD